MATADGPEERREEDEQKKRKEGDEEEEEEEAEVNVNNSGIIAYCGMENCRGVKSEAQVLDADDLSCPVCYEDFDEGAMVAVMRKCGHHVCKECMDDWQKKNTVCPFCATKQTRVLYYNKPIKRDLKNLDIGDHTLCLTGNDPLVGTFLAGLNDTWRELYNTIVSMQRPHYKKKYLQLKDNDILDLSGDEVAEVLSKTKMHATIKTVQGRIQTVAFATLIRSVIRLVISEHYDFDIETDDDYADEAARCIGRQLKACPYVLATAMNRDFGEHVLVRRFDRFTVTLVYSGYEDTEAARQEFHHDVVGDKLKTLKECNFDRELLLAVRNMVPPLLLKNIVQTRRYYSGCCENYQIWYNRFKKKKPENSHLVYDEEQDLIEFWKDEPPEISDSIHHFDDEEFDDEVEKKKEVVYEEDEYGLRAWVPHPAETDESESEDENRDDSEELLQKLIDMFHRVRNKSLDPEYYQE